jgi:N-acetylglutamate synthase-like GNAT family acetyltransferase
MINGISMRPAKKTDSPSIRRLLKAGGLRTKGIRWERFVVAVDENQQIIGCGQSKNHHHRFMEVLSIAVDESRRRGGVGREIIDHLTAQNSRPLFLMCKADLVAYYGKRGFYEANSNEIPFYFRRMLWIMRFKQKLFGQKMMRFMRMD